jgi:hypothetical protein
LSPAHKTPKVSVSLNESATDGNKQSTNMDNSVSLNESATDGNKQSTNMDNSSISKKSQPKSRSKLKLHKTPKVSVSLNESATDGNKQSANMDNRVSLNESATDGNKQSANMDNSSISKKSQPVLTGKLTSANKSSSINVNCDDKSTDNIIKSSKSIPELDNKNNSNNNDTKSSVKEQSSYCICINDPERWCEGGSMVECESCKQWYHYRCILKKNVNDRFFDSKPVSFICGLKGCNFSEGYFIVKGAKFPTVNRAEVDLLFLSAPIKSKALSDDCNNFPMHSTPVTDRITNKYH